MILISSAAYIENEFQSEFGRLPPTFLPVGNKRLFEAQIENLKLTFNEDIFISLPDDFILPIKDEIFFERKKIQIIRNPSDISLGDSIFRSLIEMKPENRPFRILYGDTLLLDIPNRLDCIATSETNFDYLWEIESSGQDNELIWCGFFSFSKISLLQKYLIESKMDFIKSVKDYDLEMSIQHIKVFGWYDFGHVNTYFNNRKIMKTHRYFNKLEIKDGIIIKSSKNKMKMNAEYEWFKEIPNELKIYTPNLLEYKNKSNEAEYSMEYLHIPGLNEIFVHGLKPVFAWKNIFNLCNNLLIKLSSYNFEKKIIDKIRKDSLFLLKNKTEDRLADFFSRNYEITINSELSLNGEKIGSIGEILNDCLSKNDIKKIIPGYLHGDFCLSNIMFDSRSSRIKVIDPRALDYKNNFYLYGDLRYDIAKLTHSVVGLYDFIIAEAYQLDLDFSEKKINFKFHIHADARTIEIIECFKQFKFIQFLKAKDVMHITILLFLSMLPLHNENRKLQFALIANALRVYKEFFIVSEK
ncbi:hypothetical protein FIT80_06150 [Candidatus Methylopumilus universalis]|jgi:hypothetical protein|uniref:hypothetical protein n=1 Tax=Candidatus Methylopumilus universalis TaxID=2588536 RepID=UPI00111F2A1B|nr:hypothetical protein [Candidatus Methylopumilus universalis]QDC89753.1 hypothetical protein FIT79_06085 [Candidatus Methylopumilus universalis]QDC91054.1 hypothetical protein FIT80_06150 [Candidatus Methylopumilus universalis]